MSDRGNFDYEEKRNFAQRFGFVIGLIVVGGIIFALFRNGFSAGSSIPHREQTISMVKISPPPPPPPPPPPSPPTPQTPKEQKMTDVQPMEEQEAKAEVKPLDEPPASALGTGIKGSGSDGGMGLSGGPGNGFLGGSGTGGSRQSNPFGRYFSGLSRAIQDALGQNALTRKADFGNEVLVWQDSTGRIVRAKLAKPTADRELDAAIEKSLVGIQRDPTPDGLTMPLLIRLRAHRPN